MNRLTIVSLMLFVGLVSCKKDTTEPELSETQRLLTSSEWVKVAFEMNGKDVWQIFPECSKDDYTVYQLSGVAFIDQAQEVCDSTYPQRVEWQWELAPDEKSFTEHTNDSTQYTRNIVMLTETALVYETMHSGSLYVSRFEKR